MSVFMQIFQELQGGLAARTVLDTTSMDANVSSLRDVRRLCAEDDRREGAPRCRVRVVGDPEIIDSQGRVFHYYGPALLVNLDDRGMVRSLEFVGVKHDDYISEVWQLDVAMKKWKYRNLSNMQGISSHQIGSSRIQDYDHDSEPQFKAGDGSWTSDLGPGAMPPRDFFQKFSHDSHTFFVDCRSGNFVRGPPYGLLKGVIENPSHLLKPLFASCSTKPCVLMQEVADAIRQHRTIEGEFVMPSREMAAVQVAQLVYGLATRLVNA